MDVTLIKLRDGKEEVVFDVSGLHLLQSLIYNNHTEPYYDKYNGEVDTQPTYVLNRDSFGLVVKSFEDLLEKVTLEDSIEEIQNIIDSKDVKLSLERFNVNIHDKCFEFRDFSKKITKERYPDIFSIINTGIFEGPYHISRDYQKQELSNHTSNLKDILNSMKESDLITYQDEVW